MSIYIHIPFCHNICSYCDFCKFYYNDKLVDDYLDSLYKEINKRYNHEPVKTIYIGGGTPSCLNKSQLKRLFKIVNIINKECLVEFTFEVNIEDISNDLLSFLAYQGVTRLSVGVQTFNKKLLKLLNRCYSDDAIDKIKMAKKYFDVNVDLIYAIPGQTLDDLNKDLDILLSLDVDHISTYSLIIEEHTKLYIDGVSNISEDLDYEMYELINKKLQCYNHYEISNYAKDGKMSIHNLTYWNNECYYGFGLSSSGYIGNIRYDNTKSLNNYINGNYVLEEHKLDLKETIENELILGFRKVQGINITQFYDKYHIKITDIDIIKQMLDEHKLAKNNEYIYIPRHLLYISNDVLVNFIGFYDENIV